ncbi:MAG: MmcQ/YjbR family DNA-binding protein [Ruminococcus sp.]|nr:MmcQ/YjbR family DNA-binding protein [Ruminococcus sp.]
MTRQQILDYAARNHGSQPESLWLRYPGYQVLRHEGGKWYGVIMDIPGSRVGLGTEELTDVLVIKGEPEEIELLRSVKGFAPAYHMNKRHWISVVLEKAENEEMVLGLLEKSFGLTE